MSKKKPKSENSSHIKNSKVGIGQDYVVGGKGNHYTTINNSSSIGTWPGIISLILVASLIAWIVFSPDQVEPGADEQDSTLNTVQQDTTALIPTAVEHHTQNTTPSPHTPDVKEPQLDQPIKQGVKLVIHAPDQNLKDITESILTRKLFSEGISVVDYQLSSASFLLICEVKSHVEIKELLNQMYLYEYNVDIRLLELPGENLNNFISLKSKKSDPDLTLLSEDHTAGAFRKWFDKALEEKPLRK